MSETFIPTRPDHDVHLEGFSSGEHDVLNIAKNIGAPGLYEGGRIVYATGFECSLNDWLTSFITGAVNLDTVAFRGNFSVYLQSDSAVAPAVGGAVLFRNMAFIKNTRWAMEIVFWPHDNVEYFVASMQFAKESTSHNFRVRYDPANGTLAVADTPITWQTVISNLPDQRDVNPNWTIMKIMVDVSNDSFGTIRFNDRTYYTEFIDAPHFELATTSEERLEFTLQVYNDDGVQGEVNVDDVVITMDEP